MIFIASNTQDSIDMAKERFGDKVFYIDRERRLLKNERERIKKGFHEFYSERQIKDSQTLKKEKDASVRMLYSYIKEVEILSRCDYLVGAPCGATTLASTIHGPGYKELLLFEDAHQISKKYKR